MKDNKTQGASDGGEPANIKDETKKDNIVDGGVENKDDTNIDNTLKELEELKKATAGKDQKISELLSEKEVLKKEKEEKELAGKSSKEKAEILAEKVKLYEKKDSFRKAFKESSLNSDEWDFIDSGNYSEIANNIKTIFDREKELYANKKLEEFKLSQLKKVNNEIPEIKDNISENVEDHYLEFARKLKKTI